MSDDDMKKPAEVLKLRREAERRIALRAGESEAITKDMDAKRLFHELQVHQIELDMQNCELQRAQNAFGLLLDQYTALYEFNPVSYMSLDSRGYILKCNIAGAVLIGLARPEINRQPFARFVAPEDRPLFESFLRQVFSERPLETNCELRLVDKEQTDIRVQLKGRVDAAADECLLAIADVTKGDYSLSPARVPLSALSRRERETMKHVVEGKTNSAIAKLMNISPKSVETYRSRMMQKLGISNVPDLVKFSLLYGITYL
jgi:DNA-binding CsgD family transcriptional regulator